MSPRDEGNEDLKSARRRFKQRGPTIVSDGDENQKKRQARQMTNLAQ
jgi:hypothetical protein